MNCTRCKKELQENEAYTLAKTHGKYFIVRGSMRGSFSSDKLVFCESCSQQIGLEKEF